ncbi:MAG: hypothetical protein R2819_02085 [Allomuricauda sp.]
MVRIVPLCVILLFLGCNKSSFSEADLHYLNGYWEISEVTFPDGAKKQYSVNPSVDFIQLENGKGFRKKLQPKFDGGYDASLDVEFLTIGQTNEVFTLQYKSEFSDWEETLVQLDSMSFAVINEEGIRYAYKRFQPIVIPK